MTVKERLTQLVKGDANDKRTRHVQAFTDPNGKRWLFATNGHVLAMVISDEGAETETFIERIVSERRSHRGSTDADALSEWIGDPVRIQCVDCLTEIGRCSRCKEGRCVGCKGTGEVLVWRDPRPGEIADRVLNRDLVFRALGSVGAIKGSVAVETSGDSHGPVWFSQEDWQVAVMPLHSVDRGPRLKIND